VRLVKNTREVEGYRPMPIVNNEDDHYDFDDEENNFVASVENYCSWGFFDFRKGDDPPEQGYQSVPVDWRISGSEAELDRQVSGDAVQTIAEDIAVGRLPITDAAADANHFCDPGRHVRLRLDEEEIVGRGETGSNRLRRGLSTRVHDAKANIAPHGGHWLRDTAQRGDVEPKRRAADAGETAAAEPDAAELVRLPADQYASVGHLEIVLAVGQPVGGAADQERVVEKASPEYASHRASAIVNIGDLEVGGEHPRIVDPLEDEWTTGWWRGWVLRGLRRRCRRDEHRREKHESRLHVVPPRFIAATN